MQRTLNTRVGGSMDTNLHSLVENLCGGSGAMMRDLRGENYLHLHTVLCHPEVIRDSSQVQLEGF